MRADVRYRIERLVANPGDSERSDAWEINESAQVVGKDWLAGPQRAVLWDRHLGRLELGAAFSFASWAWGVNDLGDVTGVAAFYGSTANHAFLWTASEEMVDLHQSSAGFVYSWGTAINNSRAIVGWAVPPFADTTNAFIWRPDSIMAALPDLPGGQDFAVAWDINDAGWIAGASIGFEGDGPVIWTPAGEIISLGDLMPGPGVSGEAYAINNLGQVVGISASDPEDEAFIWDQEGGMIGLGRVTDGWSAAYDINDHEQVVGISFSWTTYTAYGFVWDREFGMRRLDALLDPCTDGRYTDGIGLTNAINDHGQIAANTVRNAPAVLLTPYIPGDLDEDADCDLEDLAYQLANFGRTGDATYSAGDLDCDQDVDLEDLSILLSNFGEILP